MAVDPTEWFCQLAWGSKVTSDQRGQTLGIASYQLIGRVLRTAADGQQIAAYQRGRWAVNGASCFGFTIEGPLVLEVTDGNRFGPFDQLQFVQRDLIGDEQVRGHFVARLDEANNEWFFLRPMVGYPIVEIKPGA